MRAHVRAEGLHHALADEHQREDERERQENVERGAGEVGPEVADGRHLLAREAARHPGLGLKLGSFAHGTTYAAHPVAAAVAMETLRIYEEIDIVVTPDGSPVAMAHSNNGSSDLDDWMALFGQVADQRVLAVEHELYPEALKQIVRTRVHQER